MHCCLDSANTHLRWHPKTCFDQQLTGQTVEKTLQRQEEIIMKNQQSKVIVSDECEKLYTPTKI